MNIAEIQSLAADLAAQRAALEKAVAKYNDAVRMATAGILPRVQDHAAACQVRAQELLNAVEDHRPLFRRPKSYTEHGVKYGFRKFGGGVVYGSPEQVVALIERHFKPERAAELLHIAKSPNKDAIKNLSAKELTSIGCGLLEPTDRAFVDFVARDIDKSVKAILANGGDQ